MSLERTQPPFALRLAGKRAMIAILRGIAPVEIHGERAKSFVTAYKSHSA
jgi:hypothetical protein